MNFSTLRKLNDLILATKGTYEKEAAIRACLAQCENTEERIAAAYMLTGKLSYQQEDLTTGIKESFIAKDLALEGRQSLETIAEVAILRAQCVTPPWLVIEVWEKLRKYLLKGDRSKEAKSAILNTILFEMVETEADIPFLLQILCEKVNNGVGDIMVVQALLDGGDGADRDYITRQFAYNPNLAHWIYLSDNPDDPDARVEGAVPGIPMEPQLCARVDDIAKVLVEHRGMTICQPKLDGMRVHIHIWREPGPNGLIMRRVKLFSRTLKDMTADYPEIEIAAARIPIQSHAILDGELVALGPDGEVAPFSILQTRLGRKTGKDAVKVGVVVYDLLLLDDAPIPTTPYHERLCLLPALLKDNPALRPIEYETIVSAKLLKERLLEAHERGEEGLVCKDPSSLSEPGQRDKTWIKCKVAYLEEGDFGDTFDLAVIGYTKGRGRRHGKIGALWAGVRVEGPGPARFYPICKVGSGLNDEALDWWTANLEGTDRRPDAIAKDVDAMPPGMEAWVSPEHVIEVKADMVTPTDKWAGMSLRFPRLIRRRDDKTVAQSTSIAEVRIP